MGDIYDEAARLRHELRLAEEGLANATQETLRLTVGLKTANANHEHFEREWYLRGDEIEKLRNDLTACQLERDRLQREHEIWDKHSLVQLVEERDRLQEILNCPRLTPDAPTEQYKAVLADHDKGSPVNAQDLINALMWRLRNQTRELARLNEQKGKLRADIQELTCGDPRLVYPTHPDPTGKTREPPHCPTCNCPTGPQYTLTVARTDPTGSV